MQCITQACLEPDEVEALRNIDSDQSGENSLVSESGNGRSSRSGALDCDYRTPTPLFKAIEQENWPAVLSFLTTGIWSNSPLASYSHLHSPSPKIQARTWVTSSNSHGEIKWSQLPLHAAISFSAPLPVIRKLIELHPHGVRSADDSGNLPLHLAFGFGSADNIILYLMEEFPQALQLRGSDDRLPLDCGLIGSNKVRGNIFSIIQRHSKNQEKKRIEQNLKKIVQESIKRNGCFTKEETAIQLQSMTIEAMIKDYIKMKKNQEREEEQKAKRSKARSMPTHSGRSMKFLQKSSEQRDDVPERAPSASPPKAQSRMHVSSPKKSMTSPSKSNDAASAREISTRASSVSDVQTTYTNRTGRTNKTTRSKMFGIFKSSSKIPKEVTETTFHL